MEEVLDLYCLPYDPEIPLVCMDEQPVQLVKETRQPIGAKPGHPARVDYEYERGGTANVFNGNLTKAQAIRINTSPSMREGKRPKTQPQEIPADD